LPASVPSHIYSYNKLKARRWLASKKRAHFHLHFTPTSSSWLNQVERLFGIITDRMIRRGTFHNVAELETAIYKWLASWNTSPKPFTWTASADVIIEKVRRCKESVGTAH
jgi:transposase